MSQPPQIYKATYSGVPVYEMILAEFDKPQRTRILEREVQTGPHEKVQGGYGKYQVAHFLLGHGYPLSVVWH
ncbi:unnamed protein product [Rhizopus microsporus]